MLIRKELFLAETPRDVADDRAVDTGAARRIDGLLDVNDASLGAGDDAFLFFLETAGQDDVGVMRGLGEKEVDHAEELEPFEGLTGEVRVWQRNERVEADRQQAFDLAAVDRFHDFHRRVAGTRNLLGRDAPHLRDVRASRRIVDRALAGQLIALLSVLAAALPVALAGDHRRTAALAAEMTRREAEIDHGRAVLDAFRMMLETARVQGDRAIGFREHVRGALDRLGRHARGFGDAAWIVRLRGFRDDVEARRVLGDKASILE